MKSKLVSKIFFVLAILLVLYPSFLVQAKVQDFSNLYMELNLPDDTIVLTKDTPDTDELWKTAGISDPKSEKDKFDDMGVQAIFYDPSTKSLVRLLQKQSSEARKIFNLSLLSEDELNDFLNGFVNTEDENTKLNIEKYPQDEAVFFRYTVEAVNETQRFTEIIYGTLVNGSTLSFDIFKENATEPIDESYIKQLVAGTHFTKFLDKNEVDKQERLAIIRLIASLLVLVVIVVIWIFLRKNKDKKQKVIKDKKSEALTKFYMEQKQKEENNIQERHLFTNHTTYSQEVLKNFCYYNQFIKRIILWGCMAALYIIVVLLLISSPSTILGGLIAVVLLFIFVYYQGIRVEKLVERMLKVFDKNKSMEAIFTFYEDYFTVSGIQYISKFPYLQVTEIKEYKNYIYIYIGPDKAFYLNKDGFEESYQDFMKFIKDVSK